MSCTPREPRNYLSGIHESVGLVPSTMKSYSKKKTRHLDSHQDIPSSAPRTTAVLFRNKALPRERSKKSTENRFFLQIWLKFFTDFGDKPLWHAQTKTEGKIHVLFTVRSDMPFLIYLPRWYFCCICHTLTSNKKKNAERKAI